MADATGQSSGADLVTGINARAASGNTGSLVQTRFGLTAYRFPGSATQLLSYTGTGSRHPFTTLPVTVVLWGDGVNPAAAMVGLTAGTIGTGGWQFSLNNGGSGAIRFTKITAVDIDSTLNPGSGPFMAAASVTSTAVTFFLNGASQVVNDSSAVTSGTFDIGMGSASNATGFGAGDISTAYVWGRALSLAELRQLYVEPYAMFAPQAPTQRYWNFSVPPNASAAYLIRPRSWGTQKPPPATVINAGHPLANGLQNALLLAEGGGSSTTDAQRDRGAAITYGQGTPAWTPEGLLFNGSVNGSNVPEQVRVDPGLGQRTSNPGPFTVVASVKITGNTSGGVIGVENGDVGTNGSSNIQGVWLGIGNSAGFSNGAAGTSLTALNEDVAWQTPGSPITIPLNQWTQIGLVFPGYSTTASFYVNGILKGTTSFGGGSANSGSPMQLMVGGYFSANGSANRVFTGQIRYAYHWTRLLTAEEMLQLSIEPYGMFVAQSPMRHYWGIPGTTSVTVTGARGTTSDIGRPATVTGGASITGARGTTRDTGRKATVMGGASITAARGVMRSTGRKATVTGTAAVTAARGIMRSVGRAAAITGSAAVTAKRGVTRFIGRAASVVAGALITAKRGTARSTGRPGTITGTAAVTGHRGVARAGGRPGSVSIFTAVTGGRGVTRSTGRPSFVTTSSVIVGSRGTTRSTGRPAHVPIGIHVQGARGQTRSAARPGTVTTSVHVQGARGIARWVGGRQTDDYFGPTSVFMLDSTVNSVEASTNVVYEIFMDEHVVTVSEASTE